MKFLNTAFTKIRDYFTANQGRKIFFFGIVSTILVFILYSITRISGLRAVLIFMVLIGGVGTLWDSMYTRYQFLKKVRDMQYEHLKDIADKQETGEDVVITPTFTDSEKKYLRRRKWNFVLVIMLKVFLIIALFPLLLQA